MTETTFEDELSEVALEQVASESKPEINVIMPIIQWLRGFVFVIIGAILLQQLYARLFSSKGKVLQKTPNRPQRHQIPLAERIKGKKPFTRAEAILVMLENQGCPVDQMYTLKNTVANQTITNIADEDLENEKQKRMTRRKEINRPKRKITFNLDMNKEREFKIQDIVQQGVDLPKSAERNVPATSSRLVKFKLNKEEPTAADEEEVKSGPASGSVEGDILETQSGQSGEDSKQDIADLSTEDAIPGAKKLAEQLAKEQEEKEVKEEKFEEAKLQPKDSMILNEKKTQESPPPLEKETDIALNEEPEIEGVN